MKKSVGIYLILIMFFMAVGTIQTECANQDGFSLLNKVMTAVFEVLGPKGSLKNFHTKLDLIMKDVKIAKEEKKIDMVFYYRYLKMLNILKLTYTEDPEFKKLKNRKRKIGEYCRQKEGKELTPSFERMYRDHKGQVAMGAVMGAIFNEVINLHIYLDTFKKRPEIMKKYMKK